MADSGFRGLINRNLWRLARGLQALGRLRITTARRPEWEIGRAREILRAPISLEWLSLFGFVVMRSESGNETAARALMPVEVRGVRVFLMVEKLRGNAEELARLQGVPGPWVMTLEAWERHGNALERLDEKAYELASHVVRTRGDALPIMHACGIPGLFCNPGETVGVVKMGRVGKYS